MKRKIKKDFDVPDTILDATLSAVSFRIKSFKNCVRITTDYICTVIGRSHISPCENLRDYWFCRLLLSVPAVLFRCLYSLPFWLFYFFV